MKIVKAPTRIIPELNGGYAGRLHFNNGMAQLEDFEWPPTLGETHDEYTIDGRVYIGVMFVAYFADVMLLEFSVCGELR